MVPARPTALRRVVTEDPRDTSAYCGDDSQCRPSVLRTKRAGRRWTGAPYGLGARWRCCGATRDEDERDDTDKQNDA